MTCCECSGADGIACSDYFSPLHLQPHIQRLGHRAGDFPVTEAVAASTIPLPFSTNLQPEQIGRISERLRHALRRHPATGGASRSVGLQPLNRSLVGNQTDMTRMANYSECAVREILRDITMNDGCLQHRAMRRSTRQAFDSVGMIQPVYALEFRSPSRLATTRLCWKTSRRSNRLPRSWPENAANRPLASKARSERSGAGVRGLDVRPKPSLRQSAHLVNFLKAAGVDAAPRCCSRSPITRRSGRCCWQSTSAAPCSSP